MVVSGYENYFECVWAQCYYTWTYSIFIQNHSLFSLPTLDYISKSSHIDEQAIIVERESAFNFWTHTWTQTQHIQSYKQTTEGTYNEREGMFWNCILPYKFYYFRIIVFILCTVCRVFSHIEFPDDIHLLKCAMPSIWPSISSVTNQPDRQYQPWLLTSPSWLLMWSDWQKFELTNSLLTLYNKNNKKKKDMIPAILNKKSLKMQNRTFYCENINQYKLQKKFWHV